MFIIHTFLIILVALSHFHSTFARGLITNADFDNGGLNKNSNVRPNRLFTFDRQIILYKAGQLKADKLEEVVKKIIRIFQG